jgi:phosphatidylserine/phosphatidylglycerophosphate/cardiolipin synthase-like enzyme
MLPSNLSLRSGVLLLLGLSMTNLGFNEEIIARQVPSGPDQTAASGDSSSVPYLGPGAYLASPPADSIERLPIERLPPPPLTPRPPNATVVPVLPDEFILVESWPVETTLDHPDIPDAAEVWVELLNQATQSVDFAEFYASDDSASDGRLKQVIAAIEAAATRGVPIRFLTEEKFYKIYPDVINKLALLPNTQVRRLDSAAFGGGVLHAKYFIVNGQKSFIGSQNFDWRALEHIQEIGAVIDNHAFTQNLREIFELDWTIAGFVKPGAYQPGGATAVVDSIVAARRKNGLVGSLPLRIGNDKVWVRPAFSPTGRIVNERLWDEPRILEMIEGAKDSVEIQLLTYNDVTKQGERYDTLRKALQDAAKRGVVVRLLVADWCKRKPTVDTIKDLAKTKGIEVRFMTIPQSSRGFIPFARVAHAKYMVVDGTRFWLGTSNWERDYFHTSRNVGIVAEGKVAASRLARFFDGNWTSPYAEVVDPAKEYTPPRVSE